ncbi:MAG: hypothetical protein F7B60_01835 [Desulfurococcales archaeon]|nr:hypothetical protein [Desulfurococcales archaeon]
MSSDPIGEVFQKLIEEIYWVETLEEAEHILAEKLRLLDEDLREVLLEKRRVYCSDIQSISEPIQLQFVAEQENDDQMKVLLNIRSLISTGYLLQCTPSWQSMDPETKARFLAPLYRASYAFELFVKTGDKKYLSDAEKMLNVLFDRCKEYGLLKELNSHIEGVLNDYYEEMEE